LLDEPGGDVGEGAGLVFLVDPLVDGLGDGVDFWLEPLDGCGEGVFLLVAGLETAGLDDLWCTLR